MIVRARLLVSIALNFASIVCFLSITPAKARAAGLIPDGQAHVAASATPAATPAGPITPFSLRGVITLSGTTNTACPPATCATTSCQCGTFTGQTITTGLGRATLTLNLNLDTASVTPGPISGGCDIGDGLLTLTNGPNTIDMTVTGEWCNPDAGGLVFEGSYFIRPGAGRFSASSGSGDFSLTTQISPANTWVSATGNIQVKSGL
jgi:hypothetical protein